MSNEFREDALVLRIRPVSETSLIVHWLTRGQGRVATMVRGALRPKSMFRGKLDFLNSGQILWIPSRRGDLHSLKELQLVRGWRRLRTELASLRLASCAVRWIEIHTETGTPIPGMYELLEGLLEAMEAGGAFGGFLLTFEVRFVEMMGELPEAEALGFGEAARRLYSSYRQEDWSRIEVIPENAPGLHELRVRWRGFLARQVGRIPENRQVIEGV